MLSEPLDIIMAGSSLRTATTSLPRNGLLEVQMKHPFEELKIIRNPGAGRRSCGSKVIMSPLGKVENVPLTTPGCGDAGRTTTDDPSR
jgi:hypothetical protein